MILLTITIDWYMVEEERICKTHLMLGAGVCRKHARRHFPFVLATGIDMKNKRPEIRQTRFQRADAAALLTKPEAAVMNKSP